MKTTITSKDILIAEKHGNSFSELMRKYSMSEDQLEESIRKLFPSRRASNLINTFRKNDKKREDTMKKSRTSKQQDIQMSTKTSQNIPVVPEAIIVADEINDDNVDDLVATVEEVFAEHSKTYLEALQEKESSLIESLSEAERELEKLYGIRAEVTQKVQSLTAEVRELKATIEQKVSEVGELRDYSAEVRSQIVTSELDVAAIKKELLETQAAIKQVTITVLADGWFKFEPEDVKIPHVEVSDEELSVASAKFALDSRYGKLTFNGTRQLITLDKMIQELRKEHTNIEVQFEDDVLGGAWTAWKQD